MLENRSDNNNLGIHNAGTQRNSAHQAVWVLVADKTRAVVFAQHLRHFHFVYEIGKKDKAIDVLDNDGVGRNGNSAVGRHSFTPSMEQTRQEEQALAKDICKWLDLQLMRDRFQELVLVAQPQMLGEIRKNLNKRISDTIIAESDKDLTNHNEYDLNVELMKIIPGSEAQSS